MTYLFGPEHRKPEHEGLAKIQPSPQEPLKVYLHPGQTFVTAEPYDIITILGSCIAVSLWDPTRHIGGVTHYLLPVWDGHKMSSPRYGNIAIADLVRKVTDLCGNKSNLEAKVFGGACMFANFKKDGEEYLGSRNRAAAHDLLHGHQIKIAAEDTLGDVGRKVTFHVVDGTADIEYLRSLYGA